MSTIIDKFREITRYHIYSYPHFTDDIKISTTQQITIMRIIS